MQLSKFKKHIPSFLILLLFSCNNKKPLIPKDLTNEKERVNTLLVFVGEKIEVKYIPEKDTSVLMLDGEYHAKYKILQNVYGEFTKDTIEFTAFDHYGEPAFSNYKNVLLFVSKHGGKYYHQKYQFYVVYKTKDDRWAGSYSVRDLGYNNKRNENVSAQKIKFNDDVFIPLTLVNRKEIGCWFPAPYYKIEDDRAIPVYGNYVEELFKIKKEGVLKARGLFGEGKPGELEVVDTEIAEIRNTEEPSENDWKNFKSFWFKMVKQPDSLIARQINDLALDSIFVNNTLYSKQDSRIKMVLSKVALKQFTNSDNLDYQSSEVSNEKPLFQATVIVDTVNTFEIKIQSSFIKTRNVFQLYSIKEEKKCICWQ